MNVRTDLAFEACQWYMESAQAQEIEGVSFTEEDIEGISLKRVAVTTDKAADLLQKSKGNYITVHVDNVEYSSDYETVAKIIAKEIKSLITLKDDSSVFVVGLGNHNITADALGPKVISGLVISRHLKEHMPSLSNDLNRVSAISPGVLGITGIETGEIVQGICEKLGPTHIIAIDALAAGNLERIANTIQISDTGIVPGSGVGNHRSALTKETLGIPVLAIGVPTVVGVGVIAKQSMEYLAENATTKTNAEEKDEILSDFLEPYDQMVVTPKNIDLIVSKVAKIISSGLNLALHPKLTLAQMENFL